jgi:hypothetical protein
VFRIVQIDHFCSSPAEVAAVSNAVASGDLTDPGYVAFSAKVEALFDGLTGVKPAANAPE